MGNFETDDFPNSSYADWHLSQLRKRAEMEESVAQIFVDDGTSWTFKELLEHSVHVAAGLPKLGFKSGDTVSFVCGNCHEVYALVLGCSFAGVIMAPSVPDLAASGLRQNFLVAKPKFVISREETLPAVEEAVNGADPSLDPKPRILEMKKLFADAVTLGAHADPATFKPVHIDDPKTHVFACMFSSGTTTGKQKAVKLTDYGCLRSTYISLPSFLETPGPFLNTSRMHWVSWWYAISRSLIAGWARIVMDEVTVPKILNAIHQYKPSMMAGLGSSLLAVSQHMEKNPGGWDVSSLKRIIIGGDITSKNAHELLAKKFNASIHQTYGSTEIGMMSMGDIHRPMVFGSIGRPIAPLKLVDTDTGEEIREPNKPGEIVCEWAAMGGYVDDPEATAATYDKNGWYRTGDLAYCNESGDLFIVNRVKEMFKYRGFQITPSEIEDIVIKILGVKEVAVTGREGDETVGDLPTAVVVRAADSVISEKEIQEFVEKEVDHDSKRLRGGVIFTDALPRNATGKLIRSKLREMANKQL